MNQLQWREREANEKRSLGLHKIPEETKEKIRRIREKESLNIPLLAERFSMSESTVHGILFPKARPKNSKAGDSKP